MFASIETNGATHIAIYIPAEGSDKSLPQLAKMLEQNTTFIRQGYQEASVVQAEMSISLGDTFRIKNCDVEIAVTKPGMVLGEDFAIAVPAVFTSNAVALKKERDENTRVRTELSFVKSELARTKEQLDALTALSEAGE